MAGIELATAYVSIVPSTKGLGSAITKELNGVQGQADKAGQSMGTRMSAGLGKTLGAGASKAGREAGTSMSKGFDETLGPASKKAAEKAGSEAGEKYKQSSEKSMSGLKIGAVAGAFSAATQSVIGSFTDIMSGAMEASDATDKFKQTLNFAGLDTSAIDKAAAAAQEYADKTVYNLSDIQSMTAQLAANGVKDYTGLAQAAGNLNAVAGGNAESFKSVGMVMSQTAGAGKLTTENWNQLADAIPGASGKIQEALSEAGAFTGNFRDAMAEGEITAEEFNDAVMQLGNEPIAKEAAQSTKTFEGMLGNLQAEIQGPLANAFNQLKPLIGSVFSGISAAVSTALPVLVDGITGAADAMKAFGGWLKDNQAWVMPLAISLGSLAGAYLATSKAFALIDTVKAAGGLMTMFKNTKLVTVATRTWAAVTKIAAGAQKVLNLVMKANPLVRIITIIAAVGAALVTFFTKTEIGRKLWQGFMDFLKNAWDAIPGMASAAWGWLTDFFTGMWRDLVENTKAEWEAITNFLSTTWEWISTTATTVWGGITAFFSGLWQRITTAAQAAWTWFTTMLTTVWQSVVNIASTIWNGLVAFFSTLWQGIVTIATTVWNMVKNVVVGAWNGAVTVVTTLANTLSNALLTGFNFIKNLAVTVWNAIKTAIVTAWNMAVNTAIAIWNGLKSALEAGFNFVKNLATTVWNGIKAAVVNAATGMRDGVKSAVENLKQAIQNFVDTARQKFDEFVNKVTQIPGKIQSAFASAGSWLVDAGTNLIRGFAAGIRAAGGWIVDAIKSLVPSSLHRFLPFADGGFFFADGGTTEKHEAQIARGGAWRVWAEPETGGEAYIPLGKSKRKRSTEILATVADKFGMTLQGKDGKPVVGRVGSTTPGSLMQFANGGIVSAGALLNFAKGKPLNGNKAARSLEGAPYVWGGGHPSWGDCSGAVSVLAAAAVGKKNISGRYFATMDEASVLSSWGFKRGLGSGPRLAIGFFNGGPYGGHTSSTIFFGSGGKRINLEMGGGRGDGQIGGAAAGADHSQYTDHYWFPLKSDTAPKTEKQESTTTASSATSSETTTSGSTTGGSSTGGDAAMVELDSSTVAKVEEAGLETSDKPQTWSDIAGQFAKDAVSGQIEDILGVFGVPNELPPIIKAGQQLYTMQQEKSDSSGEKEAEAINAAADAAIAAKKVNEAAPKGRASALSMLRGKLPGFKTGGMVYGGNGKNLDDVLAWLSQGEMVINSDSVDADPDMAKTLNDAGPDAVRDQVLRDAVGGALNAVPEFKLSGSMRDMLAQNLYGASNTFSQLASMGVAAGFQLAGTGARSALTAGAAGADVALAGAGIAPSMLGVPGLPTPPSVAGMAGMVPIEGLFGVAGDVASWYTGKVTSGIGNALAEATLGVYDIGVGQVEDVMNAFGVNRLNPAMIAENLEVAELRGVLEDSVQTRFSPEAGYGTQPVGDTYVFNASDFGQMQSLYRREKAKKGKVGAR